MVKARFGIFTLAGAILGILTGPFMGSRELIMMGVLAILWMMMECTRVLQESMKKNGSKKCHSNLRMGSNLTQIYTGEKSTVITGGISGGVNKFSQYKDDSG